MESQEQPSSILWCGWRDNVEWFLLECLRGRGRAEPLQIQDRGCHGDLVLRDRWFLLARFLASPSKGTAKLVVCTRLPLGSRVFGQVKQQILGTVDGKVRCLTMRVAQVKKSLTGVYDMCAAGHRVVFDFDSNKRLESRRKQADWREDLLQVAKPCVGARSQHHPESGNGGHPDKDARAESRGVVSFRGAGTLSVSPEDPVGSGPVRDDREQEGRGVMAQATAHHEVPADHDPACEPSAIKARAVPVGPTRQEREDHNAAGHVPCRSCCRACVAGRGRSGRTPDFEIVRERNHNGWYRLRVPGRQGDIGRAGGRTLSDPGHELVDNAGDDC